MRTPTKAIDDAVECYKSQLSLDPKNRRSLREIANEFHVHPSTLSNRINHGLRPPSSAHTHRQALTPGEEEALIEYIHRHTVIGHPISPAHTHDIANRIRQNRSDENDDLPVEFSSIGKNWLDGFKRRHPSVHSAFSRRIEASRYSAVSREQLEPWFDQVKELMDKHHYTPDRIWNMDETGFALGSSQSKRVLVIVDRSSSLGKRKGGSTKPVQIEPGRQEWSTLVECCSAGGKILPPLVVLKGDGIMQPYWMPVGVNVDGWHWSTSHTGWSNDTLGYLWLKDVFEPHTCQKDPSLRRLLIADGAGSHCKAKTIGFCLKHSIDLLILPSHTSHVTQPLDVGVFSSLKAAMAKQVDQAALDEAHTITKSEFTTALAKSRVEAMTERHIRTGWRASGLFPFNPEDFFSKLKEPSPPPPSASQQLARTLLGSITTLNEEYIQNHDDELPTHAKVHMRTLAETAATLKAKNTILEDKENRREAAGIREKRPRAGMTTRYQGTFFFSTESMLRTAEELEEANRSKPPRKKRQTVSRA